MSIAYLSAAPGIPLQGPSGASAHIRDFVSALRRLDSVDLFVPQTVDRRGHFGPSVDAVETGIVGWPSWLKHWREYREVLIAKRLALQALKTDADWGLVIERHSLFSNAGRRIADHHRSPLVLEVNAPLVAERHRYETIYRRRYAQQWEREVLCAADHVVAVSAWLKDWLEQEVGCAQVTHIPNAVTPIEGRPKVGRQLLGLSDNRPIVGFVGSMKPWHGVEFLAELALRVDAHVVAVGHGVIPSGLVPFCTYDPQALADVISAFSVGVAPYRSDAPPWFSPLKIMQYRAQGIPIVAPDIGDCHLLMEGCGQTVITDNHSQWIDAIYEEFGKKYPKTRRSWVGIAQDLCALVGHRPENALN